LSRALGYIETEIRCETAAELRYRVRDFWSWHRNFEVFRERFSAEYERFERLITAEGIVEREQVLGDYYEKKDGDEDGLFPTNFSDEAEQFSQCVSLGRRAKPARVL
jgi:hypothetical protein